MSLVPYLVALAPAILLIGEIASMADVSGKEEMISNFKARVAT